MPDVTYPLVAPPATVAVFSDWTAPWTRRVAAWLLDAAVLSGAAWLVAGEDVVAPQPTPLFGPASEVASWTTSPVLWVVVATMVVLQGRTGQTPGKRVLAIMVVDDVTGRPIGVVRTVLRSLAHLLDAIFMIGYLRPVWNDERRTIADSIMGTLVVRRVRLPTWPGRPRWSLTPGRITAGAAVVCLLGVGFAIPMASSGGSTVMDEPSCGAGALPAGRVTGVVEIASTHETQRRLWVARDRDVVAPQAVVWTWPAGAADGQDVAVHVDVTGPDGTVLDTVDIYSSTADAYPTNPVRSDGARADLDVNKITTASWRVSSSLRVGDEHIADCIVTGS